MKETLTIPYDIEAEQALLGAIILENTMFDGAADRITPNSFYKPSHQHVFYAMNELVFESKPIDEVILGDKLRTKGVLDECGGYSYLAELAECAPSNTTQASVDFYAGIIREHEIARKIIQTGTDIGRKSRDPTQSIGEILEEAEKAIADISDTRSTGNTVNSRDVLASAFKQLERVSEHPDEMIGAATGFIDLDKFTMGLIPKDLIIVAARPSMGKTAFAMNIATYVTTRTGTKGAVLIISKEMAAEQLAIRMLSSEAKVDMKKVRGGNLDQEDWDRLAMATEKLSVANFHINESAMNVSEIISEVRKMKRKEHGISMLIVDYLQLLDGPKTTKNREQDIAYISRSLKMIAKDFVIPVIALSQLNRSLENRTDKHPKLSDLRESGAIEQDADIILFIYRDEIYNDDSPDKGIAEIIIAKHRNGPIGTVRLSFIGKYTKFCNLSRQEP